MDQFVNAMTHYGVPKYAINLIFLSEEWAHKFKYFNDNEIKQMIHFYPTFYAIFGLFSNLKNIKLKLLHLKISPLNSA